MKIKHSFGKIPAFALKPPSPRVNNSSLYMHGVKNSLISTINYLDINIKNERYQPGMIGWGVERPHLVDHQALHSNRNIDKPILYGLDKTKANRFTKVTGKRSLQFDREHGIDLEIYKNLNTTSQRSVIKSLDFQKNLREIERISLNDRKTFEMKDLDLFISKLSRWKDSKPHLATVKTAETSQEFRTANYNPEVRSTSLQLNFPKLVSTLNTNPFQGHAKINNTNVTPFTK